MKKKALYFVGIIILIAGGFLIIRNVSLAPTAEITGEENPEVNVEKTKINPNIFGITLPFSNTPKDAAWTLFQKYLEYNKAQNLDGVRSVVYKVASVCEDPKTTIDCKARMSAAYSYGSAMKKENFTNIWSDEKQIILSTDFWLESSEDMDQYGRFRSIIFFIKDADGNLKMLSFSPTKGGATNKGVASQEEVDDRIIRYTEDNDEDGIADYEEECLNKPNDSTCVKTSPKLRDTDGDGLWDGVEALINSMK